MENEFRPSYAKLLLRYPPAIARYYIENDTDSKALRFGRDVDECVFNNRQPIDEWAGEAGINATTALSRLRGELSGVSSSHEVDYYYQRERHWMHDGVRAKGTPDCVVESNSRCVAVIDLKTARAIDDDSLRYACNQYMYGLQLAAYVEATGAESAWLLWVMNKPPFATRASRMTADALERGAAQWDKACRIWQQCQSSGVWKGYEDTEIW